MNLAKASLIFFLICAMALFALSCLTGCQTRPIKTTLDYTADEITGMPELNYSSEKDVIYSRSSINADGTEELIEFKALSSAAAYAQAEREATQARITESAVNALINGTTRAAGAVPGR